MESDLVGDTVDDTMGDAGTEEPTDMGTEEPIDTGGDVDDDGDTPIKSIQKLTGKLSQKLREATEELSVEDIKYTINSILSAIDFNKLTDEDKTDIINKIEGEEEETEQTVSEYGMGNDYLMEETLKNILNKALKNVNKI
jgi:hypothetical protein